MSGIADTEGRGAYYAAIFTSQRAPSPGDGYDEMAARMEELAARQPGFLGLEHARGPDGVGITVSYWRSLEEMRAWKAVEEHRLAQRLGRERWYAAYHLRIARVEYEYGHGRGSAEPNRAEGQK